MGLSTKEAGHSLENDSCFGTFDTYQQLVMEQTICSASSKPICTVMPSVFWEDVGGLP